MNRHQAAAFLELMVVSEYDGLPPFCHAPEEVIAQRLSDKRMVFVERMQADGTWMGLIANEPDLDANIVRDCYNNPLGFKDYVHSWLWDYFTKVLTDFQQDITGIMVRNKFIEKDNDKPER